MCNAGMRSQPFGSRELERGAVKACNLHFCIWFVYMIYMRITSLRARSHCVYALNYYFVIVTKYRKKCLTDQMLQVVEQSVKDRCLSRDGELIEFNGEADHVHILVSLPPQVAISEFMNALKTNTARVLRRDFVRQLSNFYSEPVLWSRNYCAISVGGVPLEVVNRYIEKQDRPL